MSKPQREQIQNGLNGWDAIVNNDFIKIFDRPFPLFRHTGTETNLASSFPPGSYDESIVWVNHSALGLTGYVSHPAHPSGTPTWVQARRRLNLRPRITKTGATTLTSDEVQVILTTAGAGYPTTLAPVAQMVGEEVMLKNISTQVMTVDGNGTELIDGALTYSLTLQYSFVWLYSDGTTWHVVGKG